MFRDDYERQALDIICIVKYGSTGGKADADTVRKVANILRGHSIDPPRIRLPKVAPPTLKLPPVPAVLKLPPLP